MPKTHRKRINWLLGFLLLQLFISKSLAQDPNAQIKSLPEFIQEMEARFEVKFSYVDEDIRTIEIRIPKARSLDEMLLDIQRQTQIKIQKLSERYYTLTNSTTVDICASVLDNFERNTIPGATIEVFESGLAAITDLDGRFSFENIPRKAIIQIKHLGFKPLFITAESLTNRNPCTTLLLAQNFQQLDEVVVVEFLTTGLSKQPDASIQINTDAFGILPGLSEPDVLQTIQALPGIKSIDETVSDINIRGGTNDQNLILWDGIKMYQSGHFFGLISAFNPYLTDKITIIKNGASAEYGDGVSGIIEMETKNEIKTTFFGGAGFNLISGDLYGQLPLNDQLAVQFSARRSMTDLFNTPTYTQFLGKAFQNSDIEEDPTRDSERDEIFYFYDFSGKVLYDIDPYQKIRLSFINSTNTLDYVETVQDSTQSSHSTLDQSNLSFGGNWESQWSDSFSTYLNLYYTYYNLDAHSTTSNGQQQLDQNNRVLETALKLRADYSFNESLSWHNGYHLAEVGITNLAKATQPPFDSDIKGVIRTHAIFSELGYNSPDQKLRARGGVRLNFIQNPGTFDEFIPEPRVNINYNIVHNINAEIMGELKSQATNQIIDLEQNFLGIEKRRWILADGEKLPITKSKQVSLGLNYDQKKLYLGIEGFYKEVKGISTATQGFQNQNQFNGELGQYDVKGIELLINRKTADYSAWLSYAYNLNTYTFTDITPSKFPNNLDIHHTFTLAGTYMYNSFKFGIGLNYRSGKPFTRPDEVDPIDSTFFPNRINYESPNSSRLPEYLRADASVVYDFSLGTGLRASAGASVLNVTDRKNILDTYYRLNGANEVETLVSTSLGLTPNVSFRLQF